MAMKTLITNELFLDFIECRYRFFIFRHESPAQYVKPSLSVKDSSSQDGFLCAVWIARRNLRHDLAEVALLS
jgi:hypothetical protein